MIHLGDITKISGCDAPSVNVVIGGSPCQDLSVAGTQKGLRGERSSLFMEQIRIVKEMRERYGKPRYMVWENVPGAFSSNKGADFQAVLNETVKIVDTQAPPVSIPAKGWPTAGCLMGGEWSVAWRVFDAQFWGVPQRRRRIALIADFRGNTAPEILFERDSLSGYPPQGRAAWKTLAAAVENGTGVAINNRGRCYGDSTETLRSESHGAIPMAYCIQGNCIDRADTAGCNGKGWTENVCYTLNTVDRPAVYGFKYRAGAKAGSIAYEHDKAPTLQAETNDAAVFILIDNHPQDSRVDFSENGVVQTLASNMGMGGGNTPMVLALDRACFNQGVNAKYDMGIDNGGKAFTLTSKGPGAVCIGNGQVDALTMSEVCGTLDCMHDQKIVLIPVTGVVRRLTPLECERLQGFPDGWTDIGDWTDSKGKLHKTTDSARYKALGNSISLPNWYYVLQKLSVCCGADVTMASLFDGIGGFPLIWESLNGKGACLWASEIEEFPIAVTKERFK